MKDKLIAAYEEGRSVPTNKREVGNLDDGRTYLYPTAAAMAMVELSTSTFFMLAHRCGAKPSAGKGRSGSPYLWSADEVNKIAAEKRKMPKYGPPRPRWEGQPVNVEVVTR